MRQEGPFLGTWRGHGHPMGAPLPVFLPCLPTVASLGNFPLGVGGFKKGRTSPKAPSPGLGDSVAHFPLGPGHLHHLVQWVWPLSTMGSGEGRAPSEQ